MESEREPDELPLVKQQRRILLRYPLISLSLAAGLGSQSALAAGLPVIGLGIVASVILSGLSWWLGRPRLRWLALLAATAAAFGFLADTKATQLQRSQVLAWVTPEWQPALVRLRVISRVERRPNGLRSLQRDAEPWRSVLDTQLLQLRVGRQWQPVGGRLRVLVDGDATEFLPGDVLRVGGKVQTIPAPRNPGATDLQPWYRNRGQLLRMRVDSIAQMDCEQATFHPQRRFAALGAAGEDRLVAHLGESTGALAAALVLGRREAVDRQQRDLLLETGTAHLLSVSGLHLGVVAIAVVWLTTLLKMPPHWQFLVVLTFCILYAALTGGRPPVLRATLLITVVLFAYTLGRETHPLNALAFAAFCLLVWNPNSASQIGVQLSFLAVGTLIQANRNLSPMMMSGFAEDPLERLIDRRIGSWQRRGRIALRRIRLAVWLSFWVWAITAPLIWHIFHVISPISVLANVLLGIPLTIALLSGLAAVVLGAVWGPLAIAPATICGAAIDLMTWIIATLAAVPGGHHWLPAPPPAWTLTFYAIIAIGLLLPPRWPRVGMLIVWMVVWTAIALPLATEYRRRVLHPVPADGLQATFIDVGHGTSVLLRRAGQPAWLYDCGRLGDPVEASRPIEDVLWELGITRLSGVVLSHTDADHYNGLPGLLRRFTIDRVITPPGLMESDEAGFQRVRSAIEQSGVPVVIRSAGQQLAECDPRARVLHPPAKPLDASDNANSLVLVMTPATRPLILPGDVEGIGLDRLLQQPRPPGGGVLMAPHHGSMQQDMRPLLDWARPATVIVSGSDRAARPEVLQLLSQNGARVWVTANHGAITVNWDAAGDHHVRTFLDAEK